eukprot:gnl/TRDRNA2_/TRDRNA2_41165_c0_seq1.p1 gnl/TRDRNA2_/TRDRNA2_41165_c0~~gnl/TRDRNA2_/TRDRNA2_41165_c0_seq1.p1  ORF type:complete len:155 (-),score=21.61 gnl/TRDRNA2_/TRDRNA2_41165_c0_seq1:70-513(-)
MCLRDGGELLCASMPAPPDAGREAGCSEVLSSYHAENLKRVGTSPSMPCVLSFYFTGIPGIPSCWPAILVRFDSADEAKACARAVASVAASSKRARTAAKARTEELASQQDLELAGMRQHSADSSTMKDNMIGEDLGLSKQSSPPST